MKAPKLQAGDEIRIISPSNSLGIIAPEQIAASTKLLEGYGFKVSFAAHAYEMDQFSSSSVRSRVEDIHEAFRDPDVKGILTTLGGHNCNQLLRELDYRLIADNPKRLCGYSDITALSSAIYRKTGLITYSGPHFSTLSMRHGNEYTIRHFIRMMMEDEPVLMQPSAEWSDDAWFLDQENRSFEANEGPYTICSGSAEGIIIGGNLCTLNLLQGTGYMPSLKDAILFLEDDFESSPETFDRDLQSLIHQPGFEQVKGLVIGRFQRASRVNADMLKIIIQSKKELLHLPVVADVNFGHTSPIFTFPIGGQAELRAAKDTVELKIWE
ncbi:peptidase S66 [Paenibacillus sp. FSL R7-0273]|uniref:S66 family peptidase n=1 Tax=Paenibacillus sp. FSL R7-0273 TaxID=1536772 RepID=UPI0004F7C793|nr:S66 peptidase family protein [Paenibacillus sp. FSL R7-0273]AIQ47587.1 peptidase S66 [Paenibacillus sp. FSL R7-0273]OMF95858.1 LD-carboxypeptidase [Paenibacillus sp. FSL R7-0273]